MRYFDYTATTPIDKEVLETYIKVRNSYFANTSSLHSLGQRVMHFSNKQVQK